MDYITNTGVLIEVEESAVSTNESEDNKMSSKNHLFTYAEKMREQVNK